MSGQWYSAPHGALKVAQQAHLIANNPTEQIIAPRFSYGAKQVLTDEQLNVFMKVIAEDEIWCDFFYTELTTGLRRSEICGLKWEDFDECDGALKINRTLHREKGGRLVAGDTKTYAGTRKIVLPPSTVELLRERKRKSFSPWIFHDPLRPETPMNPDSAYRQLKKFLTEAGLPNIRFHDLRRTFAPHALASGVDVKTLSTIIGHTSSATTPNIYAHVTDDMQRQAAARIDRGIGKVEATESALPAEPKATMTDFQPTWKGRRRWGTGSLSQSKSGRWTGRCAITWPDGRLETRSVHTDTEEECERLLAAMIADMKSEVAAEKERLRTKNKAS